MLELPSLLPVGISYKTFEYNAVRQFAVFRRTTVRKRRLLERVKRSKTK
jgi:hypothetical protein